MRKHFLPFALPDVGETEINQVVETIRSGWLTTGPKTREFEDKFATAVGVRHAVAVNSCTAAMHLALEAIGLKQGDEVITTPYTFAATAEVVRYFDAKPVLVDICPADFNINPDLIEPAITSQTKAIIPVHMAGLPVDLDQLNDIAARNSLTIIEDAAHAFPAKYKGRYVGQGFTSFPNNRGTKIVNQKMITCFSFYATKTITTGEGGMICTDNPDLAKRCRLMALHGISIEAWNRYGKGGSWYYEITGPGYKYNLTDIAAAMGLAQLAKAETMWERRIRIACRYNDAFTGVPELQVPSNRSDCQHAWHLYMLRLNLDHLKIDRAKFVEELKGRNIGVSVHFIPLHIHPYYRKSYGYQPLDFPVAYLEYQREVSLPIYSKMSDTDVEDVIGAVLDVITRFRR